MPARLPTSISRRMPISLLLVACALFACAKRDPAEVQRVTDGLSGSWVSDRDAPNRSGWRQALSPLDGRTTPQPRELLIHPDGRFAATYDPADHRALQRVLGGDDLGNPVEGSFRLQIDWNGSAWIRFEPGAPERRVSVSKGKLMLHAVGELWPNEPYRRN